MAGIVSFASYLELKLKARRPPSQSVLLLASNQAKVTSKIFFKALYSNWGPSAIYAQETSKRSLTSKCTETFTAKLAQAEPTRKILAGKGFELMTILLESSSKGFASLQFVLEILEIIYNNFLQGQFYS